jgi:hypothetical protein
MGNIFSKSDRDFRLGSKNMAMQNEPPSIYLTPLKDMPGGDLVCVASSNVPNDCYTPPESVCRHSEMSSATLSRRVTPGKRKFDEVCTYEFHPSAQKKVLTTRLAGVVKKSTSLISLNEHLSLCETKQGGFQSFSDQTHQSFKKVKRDVLKDRTSTLRELNNKCGEKHQQPLNLSVRKEEMFSAHCNTTEPILSSASQCIQEPRAVLTEEHRVTELSEDVCNSDMKHTETPQRSACCDGNDSCNAGYCVDATEHVDVSSGASCVCTQAAGHSEPEPVLESCVQGNAAEEQQCETDLRTQHCYRKSRDALGPPVYPRPLTHTHILTRRSFQNSIKSIEGKVCLDVEDILSSSDDLRLEFKTRSMKAKILNLKKLLKDLVSYPTVVLCRIDGNIQEKPLENK